MLQLGGQPAASRPALGDHPLIGKTIFIPAMAYGSARAFAAGFRALGVDARVTPPSDTRTAELGGHFTSGDECYPAKVTIGDFMKVLEQGGVDPAEVVFFLPTADGPCRFGQYAPYLRRLLDARGLTKTEVLSPTSRNAYAGLGSLATPFLRTAWRMLVAADILEKLLLRSRPRERRPGTADAAYEECLDDLTAAVVQAPLAPRRQLAALRAALVRCRQRFRAVDVTADRDLPLIGVVGEIFCRLNTFSNQDTIRRLEALGAEVWLSGITEWVWYTIAEQFRKLRLAGRRLSREAASAWIRRYLQHRDEQYLLAPFREDLRGFEEPPVEELIRCARPYLPLDGALGEMLLSVGKAVYLARHGADGIIDISPFSCMNGIVCEAVYPRISRDLGGIPMRTLYFDGTLRDLEADLDIYLELVHGYRRRKGRECGVACPAVGRAATR